jgi:hypothetical protein
MVTPEYIGLRGDAVNLCKDHIALLRAICGDLTVPKKTQKRLSKRDLAGYRWQIFLGTLMADVAEGLLDMVEPEHVRPMWILNRSIFEYQQKSEFLIKNRKIAFEQYGSLVARKFSELMRLSHPTKAHSQALVAEYLDWKRTSGIRDKYSGDRGAFTMHLANADKAKVKRDAEGNEYTEEFAIAYAIPSFFVHAAPAAMEEVFLNLRDASDLRLRAGPYLTDSVQQLGLTCTNMLRFAATVVDAFSMKQRKAEVSELVRQTRAVKSTSVSVYKSEIVAILSRGKRER